MSEQPTLDGMTVEQFFDICVGAALVRMKAEIAEHLSPDMAAKADRMMPSIEAGAHAGVLATYNELHSRGLIAERP